jgi:serine/threonine protein kinase
MLESRETGMEIHDFASNSEIPKWNKNVTVIEKIGEGSFGEVLKVKDLEIG